jgi:transcription antitermination factor NusG
MFPIPKRYRLKTIDRSLNWYILWVNSRQYQTQTYKFLDEYSAWIPGKKNTSKFGDDCVEISEPLFPGYIFIGVNEETHLTTIEAAVHKASLCFYFLRDMRGDYYSMTYRELEKMVTTGDKHAMPNYDAGLRVGRRVRIAVGPYTGVVGKVTSMTRKDIQVEATCLKKNLLIIVNRSNYLVLEPI